MKKSIPCISLMIIITSCFFAAAGHGAVLVWAKNSDRDLAGYNVYRGYAPGNYSKAVNAVRTNACDLSRLEMTENILYYICVAAYDTSGNESACSDYVVFLADDAIPDRNDNCPTTYNSGQNDTDLDGSGDACDADDDNDQITDLRDNCPYNVNPGQADVDKDGIGDSCDNCPTQPNANQWDFYPPQGNGIGDACDCEGNFDGDRDIDAMDAIAFTKDCGRCSLYKPCTNAAPCKGDFDCDGDVDSSDRFMFYKDYGRCAITTPCPASASGGPWCVYP